MPTLNREDWHALSRELDWSPSYVSRDELFPPFASDPAQLPAGAWEAWDEPYKLSYREYVDLQRRKDEALCNQQTAPGGSFDTVDAGWRAIIAEQYGVASLSERFAGVAEAKLGRWAPSASWRHLATLRMLDEIRHGQITIFSNDASVEYRQRARWAHTMCESTEWPATAARALLSDLFLASSAVEAAIAEVFVSRIAFNNLSFLGSASSSSEHVNGEFASVLRSIQTDEMRNSQQGNMAINILREHDREYAQYVVDKSVWRTWRLFAMLMGLSMDYYLPLEHRTYSFKELMEECVLAPFMKYLFDSGLELPWFWDQLLPEIDNFHHSMHLATWLHRPSLWWEPIPGVSDEEREWLAEKYPDWPRRWGTRWASIRESTGTRGTVATVAALPPATCDTCRLPITVWHDQHALRRSADRVRPYVFCSDPCRWIFRKEPEKYRAPMPDARITFDRRGANMSGTATPATEV